MGAVASAAVNAVFLVVALLARDSASTGAGPTPSPLIILTFVSAPRTPQRPALTPPSQIIKRSGPLRGNRDRARPARRGPPTETSESLRARLIAGEITQKSDNFLSLPCEIGIADSARLRSPMVGLLVRVGIDGRALESEVERSSGDVHLDERVRTCAQGWGPFPLTIVDGRILESWQRIAWEPASTSQPP